MDFVVNNHHLEKYVGNETCVTVQPSLDCQIIDPDAFEGKNIRELSFVTKVPNFSGSWSVLRGCEHLTALRLKDVGGIELDLSDLVRIFPGLEQLEITAGFTRWRNIIQITVSRQADIMHPLQLRLNAAALTNMHYYTLSTLVNAKIILLVPIDIQEAESLDTGWRDLFAFSFLKKPEAYPDPEPYLLYLRKNGLRIFSRQLRTDNTAALLNLLGNQQFSGFTYPTYEKLLQLADEKSMVEVRAALLDSCHRFYDEEKEQARKDRKSFNQILNPYHCDVVAKTWSWETNPTGVTLTRHKPSTANPYQDTDRGDIVIPPMVGKKNVTAIRNMFASHGKYGRIVVPDTVRTLEHNPFAFIHALEVCLPDTLEAIPTGAFSDSQISSLRIPESIKTIDDHAFSNVWTENTDLCLPDGLESIGDSAFHGSAFTSIRIPETVTKLGRYVFGACHSLQSITLPERVMVIPEYLFDECDVLTNVSMPEVCFSIETSAFECCRKLNRLSIPETLNYIGAKAFMNSGIQDLALNHVITIGDSAFEQCKNMYSLNAGNLVSLGRQALRSSGILSVCAPKLPVIQEETFMVCKSLHEADLRSAGIVMGHAFRGCSALEQLHLGSLIHADPTAFTDCGQLRRITFPHGTDLQQMQAILHDCIPSDTVLELRPGY